MQFISVYSINAISFKRFQEKQNGEPVQCKSMKVRLALVHSNKEKIQLQIGEGNGNPLQYTCLENSVDGGAWQATVHGVAKSQTRLSNFTFFLSVVPFGEGNGNPLQCSCLENLRDRGTWQATVYGVAQSRTRLKGLSSSSSIALDGLQNQVNSFLIAFF